MGPARRHRCRRAGPPRRPDVSRTRTRREARTGTLAWRTALRGQTGHLVGADASVPAPAGHRPPGCSADRPKPERAVDVASQRAAVATGPEIAAGHVLHRCRQRPLKGAQLRPGRDPALRGTSPGPRQWRFPGGPGSDGSTHRFACERLRPHPCRRSASASDGSPSYWVTFWREGCATSAPSDGRDPSGSRVRVRPVRYGSGEKPVARHTVPPADVFQTRRQRRLRGCLEPAAHHRSGGWIPRLVLGMPRRTRRTDVRLYEETAHVSSTASNPHA